MRASRVGQVTSVAAAVAALAFVAGAPRPSVAQEPPRDLATSDSTARATTDELVNAPGRERTAPCGACHSLDYIRMNSRFLDLAGWTAVVNKMVKVYGAPIPGEDVELIARYLAEQYGKPTPPP